ncbi:hypothetical protein BBJ28_00003273 [Nothophytophthora sp. Chile5]|nr:hypothetical protein BBJ28_00003273 [Nothophytophthora sp. Chile5]
MATPSSPLLRPQTRAMTVKTSGGAVHTNVNISTKLRRNSLVSDPEDMVLLREKLTRIAVGRHHSATEAAPGEDMAMDGRGKRSGSGGTEHFKVFPLCTRERPSTPPSSPQPRDVLRKQLRLKQQVATKGRRQRSGSSSVAVSDEEDEGNQLEAMMSVDEVEITPMELSEDSNAIASPPRGQKRRSQSRLSIPGHLRVMSTFSVLNKYPEGLRKRKSVHVEDPQERGGSENRASLKKTSSQVNILAASSSGGAGLVRSNSVGGELFQSFSATRRHPQDQEMEDVCDTPQPPQSPLFGGAIDKKHGQLSACS